MLEHRARYLLNGREQLLMCLVFIIIPCETKKSGSNSFWLIGVCQSFTSKIFSGSVAIPAVDTMWPICIWSLFEGDGILKVWAVLPQAGKQLIQTSPHTYGNNFANIDGTNAVYPITHKCKIHRIMNSKSEREWTDLVMLQAQNGFYNTTTIGLYAYSLWIN